MKLRAIAFLTAASAAVGCIGSAPRDRLAVDLSPPAWPDGAYERFLNEVQPMTRTRAGVAEGTNGAVSVAYNGLAARAGLEALRQGGSAADAALTAALAQVALTAGAPVSYFGILAMVYYDAASGEIWTLNAEWNTVLAETDPLSIPGSVSFLTEAALLGTEPSGRTALVGGFMRGVEAAHARFGRLPFAALFAPAIHMADTGMPVTAELAEHIALREGDLSRLPATRAVFTKEDGSFYTEGDVLRQPALAATLRAVAEHGAGYMYGGPWGEKLIAALEADGGRMALEDLVRYEVIWAPPLRVRVGDYELATHPWPNAGGVAMIEALNLAVAADLPGRAHWSVAGDVLRDALNITQANYLSLYPRVLLAEQFPGIELTPEARVRPEHAAALWSQIAAGAEPARWARQGPGHSDDVVAIDGDGNIAAITHTINCVMWGKTAIMIDGVSIGDPGSHQQALIAEAGPGQRLPSPTETGVLLENGVPAIGFASMGAGLHQRTFQALLNVIVHGMTVDQAIDAPDFFLPHRGLDGSTRAVVPEDRFAPAVLRASGLAFEEVAPSEVRFGGEGVWIAIRRDPRTGVLRAASHNRNNSAALAF